MEIIREKEFVNQYHFDARNHEWEKENGVPVTKLNVDFQLLKHSREENKTSMITILRFMIVLNQHVITGAMSQAVHLQNRFVEEPTEFTNEDKRVLAWCEFGDLNENSSYYGQLGCFKPNDYF